MSKGAVVSGADGLIIEVHNNPKNALSDGEQSLTPADYAKLVPDLRKLAEFEGRIIEF